MRAAATPFEKTSHIPRSLLTLCAVLCALLTTSAVLAQDPPADDEEHIELHNHIIAGFGLEMAYPFGTGGGDLLNTGSGANIQVGYDINLQPFRVLVGVIGSYLYFPSSFSGVHEEDVDLKRLQASIAGGYVLPIFDTQALIFDVFTHLGAGFLNASSVDQGGVSETGFAFDVGVTIDYNVLPELRIGLNGGYGQVLAGFRDVDNVHWGMTELHFMLDF